MCMMGKAAGFFALIPATMLLTVSFFVLFASQKVISQKLKRFGIAVAVLLWASALLVFSAGAYTVVKGRPPFKCPMMEMMKGKKGMMHDKDKAPSMPMPGGMQGSQTK